MKTTNKRKLVFLWAIFSLILSQVAYGQERRVSGKITGADDNLPIPGVSVSVKGNQKGTSTDVNGQFVITAKTGDILVFRAIGFQSQEKPVGEASIINVALKSETSALDEVVVIGYGVQKKKLTTGANLQVKGDDLQKQNTTSALQALQGQAPGVQITSSSGQPGSGINVVIRGKGTIANYSPLYVVDGIITGDISYLNPADIESIDVLKDAASAAIYGSQAANGVILVTTRTGRTNQKTAITFDAYTGVQQVARKMDLLNARELAVIMNEAAINSKSSPFFTAAAINAMGSGTNWMDEMFVNNAATANYSLGLSGGTKASIFSGNLSYTNQAGIIGGKDVSNYSRLSFRFNSEHNIYKDKVKLGQHATYTYFENPGIGVGGQYNNSFRSAFGVSPFLVPYDENGNYMKSTWDPGEANPYAEMIYNNQRKNSNQRVVGDIYLSVEPVKNLKFRTSLGINYSENQSRSYRPTYQLSIYSFNNINSVSQSTSNGRNIMFDNLVSYRLDLKQHQVEMMAGSSMFNTRGTNFNAGNVDLRFDGFNYAYISNAEGQELSTLSVSSSPWDPDKRLSYFGRLNYNYKEKYLLNATFRADGSSRFAKGNRWGYFPSVAAGWVVTSEDFLKSTRTWLDYLKLRASWGQVGNQNISFFQYLQTIKFDFTNYTFGTEEGKLTRGAYPNRLGNPDVKWETSEQTNFGLDSRFLNGKLSFNFDYYIKNTKDWLIAAPILATAGADAPFINGGSVKNSGIELALSFRNKINRLNYSVGLNGSYNKNTVGEIPNREGIIHGNSNALWANAPEFYRAQNGMPIGYYWGYKTAGVFQSEEDLNAYRSRTGKVIQPDAVPGDLKFVDTNNDGMISELDKTNIGNPNPDYTFGINLSADYKGFDFLVQASGVAGNQLVQSYRGPGGKANYSASIMDRWHGPGSSNKIPRVTLDNRNWGEFSDLYVHNGDFLRINTVTVGYNFTKLINKSYLKNLRLYASALNLFTFTKYEGMDPEIGYSESFTSGVDVGYYPRPRIFMLGTNIKF